MARQIIILRQNLDVNPGVFSFQVACWIPVPASRQQFYANPSATSQVTGLSAAELTAIQNGSVYEKVDTVTIPNNGQSLAAMWPTIQTELQNRYAACVADLNAYNPWKRFGTYWDGSTWTVATVA